MGTQPARAAWLILAVLELCQAGVQVGVAAEDPGWPSAVGDGTCRATSTGLPLITEGGKARKGWASTLALGRIKSKDLAEGEFLGSAGGCIVSGGLVFATTFRPSGDVLNERTVCRYWPDVKAQVRSLRQIDADDVLVAVDAESGRVKWQAVEAGKAVNLMAAKRGYCGATPAAGDGRVFSLGGLGVVYAYEAASGKKLWEYTLAGFHAKASAAKAKAMTERASIMAEGSVFQDQRSGLVVAGGIVVVPDSEAGLVGLDTGTGAERWRCPGPLLTRTATPLVYRDGDTYLLLCPHNSGQNPGQGQLTAVDALTGQVLWTLGGLGRLGSVAMGDGRVLLNTRGDLRLGQAGVKERDRWGLIGCWQVTRSGAKALWVMEDKDENLIRCKPDRGLDRLFTVEGEIGYGLVGRCDADLPDGEYSLISFDMRSGRILQRLTWPKDRANAAFPLAVDGRLFVAHDLGHAGKGGLIWMHGLDGKGGIKPASGVALAELGMVHINAYEVLSEMPYWRGRFYSKTETGLACVDLRAP